MIRWSRLVPVFALLPAASITSVAFVGAVAWTIYISFTGSRRFPEYGIDPDRWSRQYERLFRDNAWDISLGYVLIFGIGSALAIAFGFVIAAMIEREKRDEAFFRTLFLCPLAVSLIVTVVIWRWMFNPRLGVENFLHNMGWESASFNWLASSDTAMYGIILATIWQSAGIYKALMLTGLKSINTEIWTAAKLDGGVVQQIGTPDEIYETPANIFVAGFIGSPAMNLIHACFLGNIHVEVDHAVDVNSHWNLFDLTVDSDG